MPSPSNEVTYRLTEKQLADVALAAAKEASRQTSNEIFSLFDINLANVSAVRDFRDDIRYIHDLRTVTLKMKMKALMVVVVIVTTALGAAMWEAFKTLLTHHS